MTLSQEDGQLYYKLWLPLLDFVNKKYRISRKMKSIATAKSLNPADVKEVANKLWSDVTIMNLHPHAVRSASRSPDPMEMVSLAAVPLASFKPPFERRLAVRTRAVHKPSIRRLFAFGIPFRVFIPQPGSGSIPDM